MMVRAAAIYKKKSENYLLGDCAPQKSFLNTFSAHHLDQFESKILSAFLKNDVRANKLYVVPCEDRVRFHIYVKEDRNELGDVLSTTMMVLKIESNNQLNDLGVVHLMQRIWLVDQGVEGCTLDMLLGDPTPFIRDVKIAALQGQLNDIKQVMLKNVELVQIRGEHLEKLVKDTDVLVISAQAFSDSASQLNKGCFLSRC